MTSPTAPRARVGAWLARLPDPSLGTLGVVGLGVYALFLLVSPLRYTAESDSTLPWGFALGRALYGEARMTEPSYAPVNGALFVVFGLVPVLVLYGLQVRAIVRRRGTPRLATVLAIAAGYAALLAVFPKSLASDVFSYMVYGRLELLHHANALIDAPALHPDAFLDRVAFEPFHYTPSAYGPVWLVISRGVTWLAEALGGAVTTYELLYKAVTIGSHLGCAALIWRIVGRLRPDDRAGAAALYAWNPLMLVETAWNPHNDVIVLLVVLLAIASQVAGRRLLATALYALSVPIKWVTVLLLPLQTMLLARQSPDRGKAVRNAVVAMGLAGVVVVGVMAPWWRGPATLDAIVHAPSNHFSTNSLDDLLLDRLRWRAFRADHPHYDPPPWHPGMERRHDPGNLIRDQYAPMIAAWPRTHRLDWSLLPPRAYAGLERALRGLGLLVVLAVLAREGLRIRDVESMVRASVWTLFAYLVAASAWFWPWYLVWYFGLACVLPWSRALRIAITFSLSASLVYFGSYFGEAGFGFRALLVFVPPLALLAYEARRSASAVG